MAKVNFVSNMSNDLGIFKKLLEEYLVGYLQNPSELEAAIKNVKDPSKENWSYDIPALKFVKLDLGKVICPRLDKNLLKNAVLELKLNIGGYSNMPAPIDNPIIDYSIQITVKVRESEKVVAKNIWRFELHQIKDKEGKLTNRPEFCHPLYHLHFGGNELNEEVKNSDTGNILVLKTPRIMHPPMDIVLAIDFVLNHFYSCHTCQAFINLTTDPKYIKVVKNARERFWKPFAFGLAANFATGQGFGTVNGVSVSSTYAKNLLTYSEKH